MRSLKKHLVSPTSFLTPSHANGDVAIHFLSVIPRPIIPHAFTFLLDDQGPILPEYPEDATGKEIANVLGRFLQETWSTLITSTYKISPDNFILSICSP